MSLKVYSPAATRCIQAFPSQLKQIKKSVVYTYICICIVCCMTAEHTYADIWANGDTLRKYVHWNVPAHCSTHAFFLHALCTCISKYTKM